MDFFRLFCVVTALAGTGYSQFPQTVPFCDAVTSICYASYTSERGVAYRVALPNVTDESVPTDAILQIVAPVSVGWSGFTWGGNMLGNPLSVGWSSGTGAGRALISSRWATTNAYPSPYTGAEYTYLKGTGTNKTHWTVTVRCRGCTSWTNADGNLTTISPTGTTVFAWAMSSTAPKSPKSNTSTFEEHDHVNQWQHNMDYARSPLFDTWVAKNLLASTTSSTRRPGPTSRHPTSTRSAARVTPTTLQAVPAELLARTDQNMPRGGLARRSMPTACAGVPAAQYPGEVASGWAAVKVKGGMISARGVVFDTAGNLLVVESGKGITAHTLDGSGCISSSKTLIKQNNLNHGIFLNGTTLYASSMTTVWKWTYDPKSITVGSTKTVVVTGMYNEGHPTRSLIISRTHPNLLIVSHGSNDNFDFPSGNVNVARSNIKVFDMNAVPTGGYNYVTGGHTPAYGLRNEVGLTFDPNDMFVGPIQTPTEALLTSGRLWGVENSSDDVKRTISGVDNDIHIDNPADTLHYFGDITTSNTTWYGYPTCYTVWNPSSFTDKNFSTGDQFVLSPNSTYTDANCTAQSTPARLSFQAHSAPLDCKFDSTYKNMYITFHGSYDRPLSTGFKVVQIPFTKTSTGNYEPVAPMNSSSGYTDIWWNQNVTSCSQIQCFRPVSIVMDSADRMYITSDAAVEGELWLVGKI